MSFAAKSSLAIVILAANFDSVYILVNDVREQCKKNKGNKS